MSAKESEVPAVAAAPAGSPKLLVILAGAALLFSIITLALVVVLLLRPVTKTIEEGNSEVKESIEANGVAVGKKLEALRDACIDWQTVLKVASDKPDAVFKIVKSEDGLLLSLKEIQPGAAETAATGEEKR